MELRFTAKQVRTYIKSGFTPEELAAKFDCTTNDIKGRIYRIYNRNQHELAEKLWDSLEANRKLPGKKRSALTAVDQRVAVQLATNEKLDRSCREKFIGIEPIESSIKHPIDKLDQLTEDELKRKEKSLSHAVMSLESEHKRWADERHIRIKALRGIQDEIEEIENRLKSCSERYNCNVEEANQIGVVMNKISRVRREKVVALEAVRQKLDELKTVNLFVYANGRIEAPDNPDLDLNAEGYLDSARELSERPECFDLRIRDVQTLARLLIISKRVDNLVVIFDMPELETAYNAFKSA